MKQKKQNPLEWVPTLYFAMGLPFIALSLVSTLMFKDLGISNEDIALWTSWLILPWSLKWLISPIMETFGTKKKYIVITEIASAILFGIIIFALSLPNFFTIVLLLMAIIALSGSMHDIAGDGIYLNKLDTETQSIYSGWQGAFYNMAKILANGGLVFLAGWLYSQGFSQLQAWQCVMGIFGLILLGIGIYHIKMLPEDNAKNKDKNVSLDDKLKELANVFVDFFKKKYIFLYFAFIFLYRFAEGLAMKIAPIFLTDATNMGGIGLNNEQYGVIYGTFGAGAFVLGSILAGYYISYFGLKKVLFSLVCIFNIPFVVYLLFALYQPQDIFLIATGIVFEYFTYGFGFVGLTLFMMQQIAPGKYQMAHYAIANSLMNFGVMVPGMISGYLSTTESQTKILHGLHLEKYLNTLAPYMGYKLFFIIVMVATIPVIVLTKFVPFTHHNSHKTNS